MAFEIVIKSMQQELLIQAGKSSEEERDLITEMKITEAIAKSDATRAVLAKVQALESDLLPTILEALQKIGVEQPPAEFLQKITIPKPLTFPERIQTLRGREKDAYRIVRTSASPESPIIKTHFVRSTFPDITNIEAARTQFNIMVRNLRVKLERLDILMPDVRVEGQRERGYYLAWKEVYQEKEKNLAVDLPEEGQQAIE